VCEGVIRFVTFNVPVFKNSSKSGVQDISSFSIEYPILVALISNDLIIKEGSLLFDLYLKILNIP
jgi:hypothetical protein